MIKRLQCGQIKQRSTSKRRKLPQILQLHHKKLSKRYSFEKCCLLTSAHPGRGGGGRKGTQLSLSCTRRSKNNNSVDPVLLPSGQNYSLPGPHVGHVNQGSSLFRTHHSQQTVKDQSLSISYCLLCSAMLILS